jgi:pimeloyl-ACP methyl ester carboxylesterase
LNPRWRRALLVAVVLAAVGWQLAQRHLAARGGGTVSGVAVAAAPDVLRLGQLVLEPCSIGAPRSGAPPERAYCTGFEVPEDWNAPAGRHIALKVAIVRADTANPEPDLVTFLDGGPGGAATDDYPAMAGALAPLRKRHALLLVDQRGTGGSNVLDCEAHGEPVPAQDGGAPVRADAAAARAAALARLQECLKKVTTHAAPEHYATSDAVRDLEALRQALGSPTLDLVGVSYGTRMAQQYARVWPRSVRAIVLDSPVPNELALGSENARNLEDVLQRLAARCRAEQECTRRFGDPYATLQRVHARLAAQPQALDVRDPYTFQLRHRAIGGNDLAQLLRFYAYSPLTAALIPYVVSEADAGRYAPLLGQAQLVIGDVEDHVNGSMALSVLCAEDADRVSDASEQGTVLGTDLVGWLRTACAAWPHGTRPAGFNEPFASDLPVLLLTGSDDPVTPPRYARDIVKHLPNGRVLELAGQGHAVLGAGCAPRLAEEFLRTLDARALDARCLALLGTAPAFIDANGAAP